MVQKMVSFSDLTNKIIDGDAIRIVVERHPALTDGPVELEVGKDEAEPIRQGALDVVTLKLYQGDGSEPETVVMETGAFDKLAVDMDMADVLRRAEPAYPPRKQAPAASTSTAEAKVDYGSIEHAGRPKRGKVSDAEKATVAAHLDEINERLRSEGHRTIELDNAEHVTRYGLEALAKEAGHFQQ